jgi:hypothetical protein
MDIGAVGDDGVERGPQEFNCLTIKQIINFLSWVVPVKKHFRWAATSPDMEINFDY